MPRKVTKHIGDVFGRLTIIENLGTRQEGPHGIWVRYYLCQCECGNKIEARCGDLGGKIKSCGCMRREVHRGAGNPKKEIKIGDKYDRLTVIEDLGTQHIGNQGARTRYYLCECECGNRIEIRAGDIGAKTGSCGCLQRDRAANQRVFVEGTNIATISQNNLTKSNTSGVRGVSWARGQWHAYIGFKNKRYNLGYYRDLSDATRARKEAEDRIYGEFLEWYRSRELTEAQT